jgi:hypothetical protein
VSVAVSALAESVATSREHYFNLCVKSLGLAADAGGEEKIFNRAACVLHTIEPACLLLVLLLLMLLTTKSTTCGLCIPAVARAYLPAHRVLSYSSWNPCKASAGIRLPDAPASRLSRFLYLYQSLLAMLCECFHTCPLPATEGKEGQGLQAGRHCNSRTGRPVLHGRRFHWSQKCQGRWLTALGLEREQTSAPGRASTKALPKT